ncbi:MAG: hypothetical protein FJ125_15880 [Deltaproteobacteria bacterium]|nr:hypothetical protein [Deltaproteobacteria bacterium]
MMRTCCTLLLLLALSAAAGGCGDEYTNAVFDEDTAFLAAVPLARELALSAPWWEGGAVAVGHGSGLAGRQQALGEGDGDHDGEDGRGLDEGAAIGEAAPTSELYRNTRGLTLGLDQGVFWLLRPLDEVIAEPPALRLPDRRIWGPCRHPLDPAESRLVVQRQGEGVYGYVLEQRLVVQGPGATTGQQGFAAVLSGEFSPEAAGVRRGAGAITFDLDQAARFALTPGRGLVHAEYEKRRWQLALRLWLQRFSVSPEEAPLDAALDLLRYADGSGDLEWAARDEQGQLILLRSRWLPDGSGRGDLQLLAGAGGEPLYQVSECWGTSFAQVYRRVGLGQVTYEESGSVQECSPALRAAAWTERVQPPPLGEEE